MVTAGVTPTQFPRSDTSHCVVKRDGGMWPKYGACGPFAQAKPPILLMKTAVARLHRRAGFSRGLVLTPAGSDAYIHPIRHAAVSVRRRVFEAPH